MGAMYLHLFELPNLDFTNGEKTGKTEWHLSALHAR